MSKRITTRWFVGAWIVAVLVGVAVGVMARAAPDSTSGALQGIVGLILVACGIVMFVMWIGALIKLGQQRRWGWFAFVLLLYVLTLGVLGIVAMAVYALAGPDDPEAVVTRPTVT